MPPPLLQDDSERVDLPFDPRVTGGAIDVPISHSKPAATLSRRCIWFQSAKETSSFFVVTTYVIISVKFARFLEPVVTGHESYIHTHESNSDKGSKAGNEKKCRTSDIGTNDHTSVGVPSCVVCSASCLDFHVDFASSSQALSWAMRSRHQTRLSRNEERFSFRNERFSSCFSSSRNSCCSMEARGLTGC